jgi:hypothetical protein
MCRKQLVLVTFQEIRVRCENVLSGQMFTKIVNSGGNIVLPVYVVNLKENSYYHAYVLPISNTGNTSTLYFSTKGTFFTV